MTVLALRIEPCEYANEIHLVRVSTEHSREELIRRAKTVSTHYFYDGDEERGFLIFSPKGARSYWFDIQESDLVIHGYWHHEGDDLLDGTLPEPQQPSLDDRIEVVRLIKEILQ